MRDQYDYQGGRVSAFGDHSKAWDAAQGLVQEMERARTQMNAAVVKVGAAWLGATFLALFLSRYSPIFGFVPYMLGILAAGLIYSKTTAYKRKFKEQFCGAAVQAAYPGLVYCPDGAMSFADYNAASLWGSVDRVYGSDYFEGTLGETPIRFSLLCADRRTGSGKNKRWTRIFTGILVQCGAGCHHQGWTLVCPAGSYKSRHQTEVKVRYPGFEQYLQIFTSSPQDAAHLFTPEVAEMLMHMVRKYGSQFRIALYNETVYATFGPSPVFEYSLFQPVSRQTLMSGFSVIEHMATFAADMKRTFAPAGAAQMLKVANDNPYSVAIGDDI